MGSTEFVKVKEFSLGAGRLYVLPGRASETALERQENMAGETDGACVLRYEYKARELYDLDGKAVSDLRFGERVTVKGRLGRIFPETMPAILSGDRTSGGTGYLSVLIVCPLPGGESFRLCLRGAVTDRAVFNVTDGGGLEFELTCGGDVPHPRFCLKGERGYA